jgi:Zn-dependent oligopeptidase
LVFLPQLLSRAQLAALCPETLTVAGKYCQDFEKYGIHLTSSSQRAEVARLLALNQHYPARFNAALVRGTWPANPVLHVSLSALCS